jgi:hypothetical protein
MTDGLNLATHCRGVFFVVREFRRRLPGRRRVIGFIVLCGALACLSHQSAAAGSITQTQSTSAPGVLVQTNWGAGTAGVKAPLVFNDFAPNLGPLTSITLTLTTNIRNDYELVFVNTPIITTIGVATSATSDQSILSDPAKRAQLTDGPTISLLGPDAKTPLFAGPGARQPVDFVEMTETSGKWSSLLPPTDPHFIPPTITTQTFTRTLTLSNAPSIFPDFIGNGTFDLPVTATAFSSFFSTSGNGGGAVITRASATVSIEFDFVPEPTSVLLLGLGFGIIVIAGKAHGRSKRARSGASMF